MTDDKKPKRGFYKYTPDKPLSIIDPINALPQRFKDVSMGCNVPKTPCPPSPALTGCSLAWPRRLLREQETENERNKLRKQMNEIKEMCKEMCKEHDVTFKYPMREEQYRREIEGEWKDDNPCINPSDLWDACQRYDVSNKTMMALFGFSSPNLETEKHLDYMKEVIYAGLGVPKEFISPEVYQRVIGIDWATTPATTVMSVVKRLGEPNANGDIFVMSEPEYVGDFQVNPEPLKIAKKNSTAERIKKLTDNFQQTLEQEGQYGTPLIQRVIKPLMMAREMEKRLVEIQERSEWLAEYHEIDREQYYLYRERQSVEAKLHTVREEIKMEQEKPRCPRCNKYMVLREANNGVMKGSEFYGCGDFPKCTGTRTKPEVDRDFPYFHSITASILDNAGGRYLELKSGTPTLNPIFGKRISLKKFNGDEVFQSFIEPLARAVNKPLSTVVFELLKALHIPHPTVVAKNLVKNKEGFPVHDSIEIVETVDTIGLQKIMETSNTVIKFKGEAAVEKELYRFTLERRPNVIQLRAKNKAGQTICTGEMPEVHVMGDINATKELITEFLFECWKRTDFEPETVQQILLQDLEKAQEGPFQRTAALLHSVAMQIKFVPRKSMSTGRFTHSNPCWSYGKTTPPPKKNYGYGMTKNLAYVQYIGTTKDSVLFAVNSGGVKTESMSHDHVTLDMRGAVEGFIKDFIKMLKTEDDVLDPSPTEQQVLTALVAMGNKETAGKAQKIGQVAECMLDKINKLRGSAKQIPFTGDRSKDMNETYRRNYNAPMIQSCASDVVANELRSKKENYSPETQRFISAQRKAAPKKIIDKVAAQHEQAIRDEKYEKKNPSFAPKACKCGSTNGCMCPREETPVVPECQHRFVVLIPHTVAGELGFPVMAMKPEAKIYACRDCHQVVFPDVNQINGKDGVSVDDSQRVIVKRCSQVVLSGCQDVSIDSCVDVGITNSRNVKPN